MKYIEFYNTLGLHSSDEVFDHLLATMKDTIRTYDFFVAWKKVLGNVAKVEVSLSILNTLIGKKDIEVKLKDLIKEYPEVVSVIPLLIAVRDTDIKIAELDRDVNYSFPKKNEFSNEEIDKIVYFSMQSGLLQILSDRSIKNLVDYVLGVEVGLDTNARKNRSGTCMEALSEFYVKAICDKHQFRYIAQATAAKIMNEFGKEIKTDKADRHFDFAIDTGQMLYLLEVNYYSGGGSKLKAVAGEFLSLFELIKSENTGFIWLTDGKGWGTAKKPLLETYEATDHVMNLNMVKEGLLENILVTGS